jgi:myo-inositol-1(or 4)-monophosphatase
VDDVELAAALVQEASRRALEMRLGGVDFEQKTSAADLVSAADRAAEALIRDRLRDERPEDGVLGEEGSSVASRNGRRWVIDPVDGTFNFLWGLPTWCSAVALDDDDGVLLAGAVEVPAARET